VRVADRPRFPSPSAVLGPVHASAPRKIHYALSIRYWRHLLDAVDHPGLCRRSATFHQLASLMPKLPVRNPRFASAAIRNQLVTKMSGNATNQPSETSMVLPPGR